MLKSHRLAALALLAACATVKLAPEDPRLLPIVTNPRVVPHEVGAEYVARGTTVGELIASLETGPAPISGNASLHDARITYSYSREMRAARCHAKAEVNMYTTTIVPRWSDSAVAQPEAQKVWGEAIEALRIHVENHRRIIMKHASQFERAVYDLQQLTCPQLDADVERMARAAMKAAGEEQRDYDVRTRGGATEGVRTRRRGPGVQD